MHVHFIAVSGTGMGSLAGLFKAAGHHVTGSDTAFHPPMGPALKRWGIGLMQGFDPAHLNPQPDLVVVGNVCRPWNEEARAAIDGGMAVTTMVGALADHVLPNASALVVGGTHGKTTTSALCAWLLDQAGLEPGFLIGGLPKDFEHSFQLPGGAGTDADAAASGRNTPFVIEGDEYDTAFFDKTPKFWHYRPEVAIVTSLEHDHIDIYPDAASYRAAFAGFVARIPNGGLIVAHAADAQVVEVVSEHARCQVAWYALAGDETHRRSPAWLATPRGSDGFGQRFDLRWAGGSMHNVALNMSGEHNLRNALAALAATTQGYRVPLETASSALGSFSGVARRQDLLGVFDGVRVYDDFAHHPTAIRETLRGLRRRHGEGALWAVYEPRTATACRALHQDAYVEAFDAADQVIFAPLGRDNIPSEEQLDLPALVSALADRNVHAETTTSIGAIVELLRERARPGDTIALLSNGAFGGIYPKLTAALDARNERARPATPERQTA